MSSLGENLDSKKCGQKVKLLISYDGTDFKGWQKQPSTDQTVQGQLEHALQSLLHEPVRLIAAGRTDAGVHAIAQVAHFTTHKTIERYNLVRALNTLTSSDIVVREAWLTPEEFHAQISAHEKTYKYLIYNHPIPSAFRARYATWIPRPLDPQQLQALSTPLLGEHDFQSFQTKGTEVSSTVRQIHQIQWKANNNSNLEMTIRGSGFLKQMVRNIVGTLLDLSFKGGTEADVERILKARDRCAAGTTAPPEGLYLFKVFYPPELDNKCRKL